MEKLLYIEPSSRDRKKEYLASVICALLLSLGICTCFGELFSLADLGTGAGTPGGGLVRIWNQIAGVLGSSDYIQLPVLQGASNGAYLFALLGFIGITASSYFLIRSRKCWTLLILLLPLLACNLLFQLPVSIFGAALLTAATLLAVSCMKQGMNGFWMHLLWTAVVTVIAVAAIQLPGIYRLDEKPQALQQLDTAIVEHLQDWRYGVNPLGSGNLTKEKRDTSEDMALEVTMETPRSMYLRGFVGEQYDGSSWEPLSDYAYMQQKELTYWLGEHDFYALGQLGKAAEIVSGTADHSTVTVSVKHADRRYAYVPYEITQNSFTGRSRSYGGSFVGSPRFGRLSEYSYQAGSDGTGNWTTIASELFTAAKTDDRSEQTEQYLHAESYYNNQVYETDTYLSDSDRELLSEYLGASGDQSKGHIDYKLAITGIKNYLKDSFVYTENPGDPMKEGSALETFLTSGKGYDVQFATAATLMFRYYGIPARYVEGYLITPEDAAEADVNGTVSVSASRAHAWTEIYIDGAGFVPIEVSPEYEGVMQEADMSVGISNNTLLRSFESSGSSAQNNGHAVKEAKTRSRRTVGILQIIAWLIVLAAIVFCLLLLLPKVWKQVSERRRRRKLFLKAEPKRAVSGIYEWLEQNGMEIPEDIRELGNRAAYSPLPIEEADRGKMLQAYKEFKRNNRRRK